MNKRVAFVIGAVALVLVSFFGWVLVREVIFIDSLGESKMVYVGVRDFDSGTRLFVFRETGPGLNSESIIHICPDSVFEANTCTSVRGGVTFLRDGGSVTSGVNYHNGVVEVANISFVKIMALADSLGKDKLIW